MYRNALARSPPARSGCSSVIHKFDLRPELALGVGDDHVGERQNIAAPGDRSPVQRAAVRGSSESQVVDHLGERAGHVGASPVGPANAQ